MSNPLFNALNPGQNNMMQMIQSFQKFKQTFNGDPKQAVMGMLQSGKISQEQLNQIQAMANQFQGILK